MAAMAQTRKPGWWIPWIFVGGFVLVAAVNGIMMWIAISSFSGLETERAYDKGLAYNKTLAEARAQAEMGWRASFDIAAAPEAAGGRKARLAALYIDRDGKSIEGLRIEALFVRPTAKGHDRALPLTDLGGGRYGAETDLPFPGVWDVTLVAARGAERHQHHQRVKLP